MRIESRLIMFWMTGLFTGLVAANMDTESSSLVHDMERRILEKRDQCEPQSTPAALKAEVLYGGTVIRYSCKNGLVLLGSEFSTCVDGKWSEHVPGCADTSVEDCRPFTRDLSRIPHLTTQPLFQPAGVIGYHLSCTDGTMLSGRDYIFCFKRIWITGTSTTLNNKNMPTCDQPTPETERIEGIRADRAELADTYLSRVLKSAACPTLPSHAGNYVIDGRVIELAESCHMDSKYAFCIDGEWSPPVFDYCQSLITTEATQTTTMKTSFTTQPTSVKTRRPRVTTSPNPVAPSSKAPITTTPTTTTPTTTTPATTTPTTTTPTTTTPTTTTPTTTTTTTPTTTTPTTTTPTTTTPTTTTPTTTTPTTTTPTTTTPTTTTPTTTTPTTTTPTTTTPTRTTPATTTPATNTPTTTSPATTTPTTTTPATTTPTTNAPTTSEVTFTAFSSAKQDTPTMHIKRKHRSTIATTTPESSDLNTTTRTYRHRESTSSHQRTETHSSSENETLSATVKSNEDLSFKHDNNNRSLSDTFIVEVNNVPLELSTSVPEISTSSENELVENVLTRHTEERGQWSLTDGVGLMLAILSAVVVLLAGAFITLYFTTKPRNKERTNASQQNGRHNRDQSHWQYSGIHDPDGATIHENGHDSNEVTPV